MSYDTHHSPPQETCIHELELDSASLLATESVDSAKAAAAISWKHWNDNESAFSAMATNADMSIQDRFSNLLSSSRTRKKKQEEQAWKQQWVVALSYENYFEQGE